MGQLLLGVSKGGTSESEGGCKTPPSATLAPLPQQLCEASPVAFTHPCPGPVSALLRSAPKDSCYRSCRYVYVCCFGGYLALFNTSLVGKRCLGASSLLLHHARLALCRTHGWNLPAWCAKASQVSVVSALQVKRSSTWGFLFLSLAKISQPWSCQLGCGW